MKSRSSWAGKHVVITGAASGIGHATALELASRGARVTLADIDAAGVEATADRVRSLGGEARAFAVDIARAASVEAFAAQLVEQCGAVDVLVNNAGVAVVAPFARIGEADLEWIVGVNVWGPLRLTRALLPAMIARDGGHVVVVASPASSARVTAFSEPPVARSRKRSVPSARIVTSIGSTGTAWDLATLGNST